MKVKPRQRQVRKRNKSVAPSISAPVLHSYLPSLNLKKAQARGHALKCLEKGEAIPDHLHDIMKEEETEPITPLAPEIKRGLLNNLSKYLDDRMDGLTPGT